MKTLSFLSVVFFVSQGCAAGKQSREAEAGNEAHDAAAGQAEAPPAPPPSSQDLPGGCEPARGGEETPVLDDFEGTEGLLPFQDGRAGSWFFYDDGTGGEQSTEYREDAGNTALRVSSTGFSTWGSGLGVTLAPSSTGARACPYDASAYAGVQLRVRGTGEVRVRAAMPKVTPTREGGSCELPGEECYDWPLHRLQLETQWRSYTIPFCSLVPENWTGSAAALDPSQLSALHFVLEGETELWLDDLAFAPAADDLPAGQCEQSCPLDAVSLTAQLQPETSSLALSEELQLHTFEQQTAECGSLTRRYLSFVPSGVAANTDAPLLMALHGSTANAESMQDNMARGRLDELARRDGFIAVYGNAAPGVYTSPYPLFPNTGAWRQAWFDDGLVDDVAYLEQVLEDMKQRGVINGNNPVYLTGISNGGGMVLEAVRRLPNRFSGVAAFMPFDGNEPKPVPDLSDTSLSRVLFGYSPNDPGMQAGYTAVLESMPARWGTAIGLSDAELAAPVEHTFDDVVVEGEDYTGQNPVALATQDSRARRLDYTGQRAQLRVLIFEDAGHFWPNPVGDTEDWAINRWGFRNQDIDAADELWDFFSAD